VSTNIPCRLSLTTLLEMNLQARRQQPSAPTSHCSTTKSRHMVRLIIEGILTSSPYPAGVLLQDHPSLIVLLPYPRLRLLRMANRAAETGLVSTRHPDRENLCAPATTPGSGRCWQPLDRIPTRHSSLERLRRFLSLQARPTAPPRTVPRGEAMRQLVTPKNPRAGPCCTRSTSPVYVEAHQVLSMG